ncbi:MAG: hypothetical protein AB2A00_19630 [Myxococcota bacterium]
MDFYRVTDTVRGIPRSPARHPGEMALVASMSILEFEEMRALWRLLNAQDLAADYFRDFRWSRAQVKQILRVFRRAYEERETGGVQKMRRVLETAAQADCGVIAYSDVRTAPRVD